MRRAALLISAVAIALVASAGCSSDSGIGGFLHKAFKIGGSGIPVAIAQPILREQATMSTVPGVLAPSDRIEVKLPNDVRIETFFVNIGDTVAKGAPLLQISKDDQNVRLAQLRAEQNELQAALDRSTYFLRNRDRLLEEGRITQEQYDGLDLEVSKTEKDLERVKTDLATLETNQTGDASLTSPIAGVVQARLNSAGGVAAANTPLVTIVSINPMVVAFRLAAYEAKTVAPGKDIAVSIADFPTERFTAKVASISTELDRETNTFEVKAALPNPQGVLKAGMNALVAFSGAELQKYFEVPAESLVVDRRRNYIFTVSKGVARRVPVILRENKEGVAQIVEGVNAGDSVVVSGADKLTDGALVDVINQ